MPKLCVALDLGPEEALKLVDSLLDLPVVFKVGPSLLLSCGPSVIKHIKDRGKEVFLDLKLHDIPTAVARAVSVAESLGADYLTVHTLSGPEVLETASKTALKVKLLGVTLLTSHGEDYLEAVKLGFRSVEEAVLHLSLLAKEKGLYGVVCSGEEVRKVKEKTGLFTVVPGVRLKSSPEDQRRVKTPEEAVRNGADMIVMGREIYKDPNPKRVVEDVLSRILP